MLTLASDQALTYQVLDEVIAGKTISPHARATIHSVIDRLRAAAADVAEIRRTESVSIALHKLHWSLQRSDGLAAESARNDLKRVAAEFLDTSIRSTCLVFSEPGR